MRARDVEKLPGAFRRVWERARRGPAVPALVGLAVIGAAGADALATAVGRDAVAVAAATRQVPARWVVRSATFSPWASDVRSGGYRFRGGAGPAWVIELAAPGDRRWHRYTALVVVDAITGEVQTASAAGLGDGATRPAPTPGR